jgi:hypothetical protein
MKNTLAIIGLIIISVALYAATLRGIVGNPEVATIKATLEEAPKPFELSPERGRFAHVISLAEHHTYELNKELADFVYPDVGYYKGKFYSFFAPGISVMAVPFYIFGKHFGFSQLATYGFISLMSICALIVLYRICRDILKLPLWASVAAVIIFAFGSTAWSYAITLYQHHVTTLFILLSFYAVWKYKFAGTWSWVWGAVVWLCYALAIAIDYPNAILMLPVMVYFLFSSISISKVVGSIRFSLRPALIATMILFIGVMGLHAYHNATHFGGWQRLSGGIISYKRIVENGLADKSQEEIEQGIAQAQRDKNVVKFFSEERVPNGFGTLFFSRDRGLLFYGPIFLLGILGIFIAFKKITTEKGVLMSIVLANVFLYSSWGDPWGGWAYGTRYLIPSMSALAVFAAMWLAHGRRLWWKKLVALVLFAYSAGVALLGAVTTNAVPPRVEADQLHTSYNFFRNIQFLTEGKSGSFVYNTYFASTISLVDYFFIIYAALLVLFIFVVYALPFFDRKAVEAGEEHEHAA